MKTPPQQRREYFSRNSSTEKEINFLISVEKVAWTFSTNKVLNGLKHFEYVFYPSENLSHRFTVHYHDVYYSTHTQSWVSLALDTNEQELKKTKNKKKKQISSWKDEIQSSRCVCVHSRLLTWCVGCVRMRPKWRQSLDWTGPVRTTLVWETSELVDCLGGCGWGLGRRRSVDSWRWRHLAIAFSNLHSFFLFF